MQEDTKLFYVPILQPNDGFISVGMSDGLVQFLHRKVPPSFAERKPNVFVRSRHIDTFSTLILKPLPMTLLLKRTSR